PCERPSTSSDSVAQLSMLTKPGATACPCASISPLPCAPRVFACAGSLARAGFSLAATTATTRSPWMATSPTNGAPPLPPGSVPPVLLLGHVDTVWPHGTLAKRPFRVDARRAFGPGIFDMKSGVALIVAAFRALHELGLAPRHPLKAVLSCDEESGSTSSR